MGVGRSVDITALCAGTRCAASVVAGLGLLDTSLQAASSRSTTGMARPTRTTVANPLEAWRLLAVAPGFRTTIMCAWLTVRRRRKRRRISSNK